MKDQFMVVAERLIGDRIDYGAAGSIHDRPPVNHLAYCRSKAAAGEFADNDARYFIARLTEIADPEPAVGP